MIQNETIRNVESIDDLTIMDDYMASKVFSDKKIMSDFLSILLGHPVNIIHCRKQVQIRPRKNAHYVIFDILAIDDHGNIYNLEIQDYGEKDLILRLTYNAGILISMALKKGKPYSELKNTTVLALCSSDPVGSGETYYDSSCPFENYKNMKMKPRTRMIALNAGGKKSSGNMDIDLLMDYIKTSRRNNGRLTVLLDDARQKICNDEKERDAFMKELYQGQKAGDEIARKQVKELAKEIAQNQKEIEEMKKAADQSRKKYEEDRKGSAVNLYKNGVSLDMIASAFNVDQNQVHEWIVSENEPKYNSDQN